MFVAVLYLAAGLFLLGALTAAARRVSKEHRQLVADLDEIDSINGDKSLSDDEQAERRRQVREPRFNYGRLMYTYEWIQRLILHDARKELRGPAVLTVLGVVSGTAASILSLWLPAS